MVSININHKYLKDIGALSVVLQQCLGEANQLTYLKKKMILHTNRPQKLQCQGDTGIMLTK